MTATSSIRTFITREWPRMAVVAVAIYKTLTPLQALYACLTDYRISFELSEDSLLWLVGSLKRSRSMIRTAMISWWAQFLAVLATNANIFLQLMLIRRVMDKSRTEGATTADLREWEAHIDRLDEPWMQKWLPVYLTTLSQGFVLWMLRRQLQGKLERNPLERSAKATARLIEGVIKS
ncbi:hypothetical protein BGZ96_009847 [Linnemannia gamsii]|uniref:Uncharacterized protein n=1 Tax=Linnemannia gamsii TaxID=64522 RepID=A0ABQ7JVM0_9FUNG|nr:hypothetical protein BGZ96_009847 [Linnemannia gamsii]